VVVVVQPESQLALSVGHAEQHFHVQALVAQSPVEAEWFVAKQGITRNGAVIMRFRPANISLINRRQYLSRLPLTLSSLKN